MKLKMPQGFYLYKYVLKNTNEPIYIGLTIHLEQRIKQHSKEPQFQSFLKKTKIHFCECANEREMKCLEMLLINYYKPILNIVDKYEEKASMNPDASLLWRDYLSGDYIGSSQTNLVYLSPIDSLKQQLQTEEKQAKKYAEALSASQYRKNCLKIVSRKIEELYGDVGNYFTFTLFDLFKFEIVESTIATRNPLFSCPDFEKPVSMRDILTCFEANGPRT